MDRLKSFRDTHLILRPDLGSFTAEAQSVRWSNKDLDPVKKEQKKWEWYHVAGLWVAEGFSAAQMETPSSAFTLGLNPGLILVACFIGNLIVAVPICSSGYIGSKVSGRLEDESLQCTIGMLSGYMRRTVFTS